MNRKYLLFSIMLICVLAILNTAKLSSKIAFPPYGSVGDPVNPLTCAQSGCHGSPTHTPTSQDLSLTIGTDTTSMVALGSGFKYAPNTTYYVTFDILDQAYAYGFQLTALTANTGMAGSFTVLNASNTKLISGSPAYIGHKNAYTSPHSWTFKWTSPSTDSGSVTFYYGFNPGDSVSFNNAVPGADIYIGSTTIQPATTAINEIPGKLTGLQVYPNPVSNNFNMAFNLQNSSNVSATVYTLDGKACQQLLNEKLNAGAFTGNYDISSLAAGIYLVKLNVDGNNITKKIVKE